MKHSTLSLTLITLVCAIGISIISFYGGVAIGQRGIDNVQEKDKPYCQYGTLFHNNFIDIRVTARKEPLSDFDQAYALQVIKNAFNPHKNIVIINIEYDEETKEQFKNKKAEIEKERTKRLLRYFSAENIKIINNAAKRNNLREDLYPILYAIRKAENGPKGLEFGIIHPDCAIEMQKRPNETMDIQAGWCAATIQKNFDRWLQDSSPKDFIIYLGGVYCPTIGATNDPNGLNKNWIKNVKHWRAKIYEE